MRTPMPEPAPTTSIVSVDSPYFEDLAVGRVFDDAPAVTLTSGHAAFHAALFGDRLRLPLSEPLCQAVTGSHRALAHPNLVCNVAIGQTTTPTQRVRGNLFYRGLVLQRPVFIGDTLTTSTEVVARRRNRTKPGRDATGIAVLQVHVENQHGETVLHFWRCPMLPCRDPADERGAAVRSSDDSFDAIPAELDMDAVHAAVTDDWRLDVFRKAAPGPHFEDIESGTRYVIEAADTVTSAPELARQTLNLAQAHTDASASPYGRRLVYGGHTISMASAQLSRALPNLVTLIAWRSCDHRAPVFEGDRLQTELKVVATHELRSGGGLVDLHVLVSAERGSDAVEPGKRERVLDWRLLALMA
jgi:2-methylfumaryl-CoA hydratase